MAIYRRTLQVNNEVWEEVVMFCLNFSQVVRKHLSPVHFSDNVYFHAGLCPPPPQLPFNKSYQFTTTSCHLRSFTRSKMSAVFYISGGVV
jgi:hypothetical protein